MKTVLSICIAALVSTLILLSAGCCTGYNDQTLGAAVSYEVNDDRPDGYQIQTFYGGMFYKQDDLIRDLKARHIDKVAISSWLPEQDVDAVLRYFEAAGITVESYYILQEGRPDWQRIDVIQERARK